MLLTHKTVYIYMLCIRLHILRSWNSLFTEVPPSPSINEACSKATSPPSSGVSRQQDNRKRRQCPVFFSRQNLSDLTYILTCNPTNVEREILSFGCSWVWWFIGSDRRAQIQLPTDLRINRDTLRCQRFSHCWSLRFSEVSQDICWFRESGRRALPPASRLNPLVFVVKVPGHCC